MRSRFVNYTIGCVLTLLPIVASTTNITEYQATVDALQRDFVIDKGPIVDLRLAQNINRAETLKVILKAQTKFQSSLGTIAAALPTLSLFPDVDQHAWYAPYVELGFKTKLITGYPDGNFWPQRGVKVEEAAAMIARSFRTGSGSVPFKTDPDLPNKEGQWYTNSISTIIANHGVMRGRDLHVGEYLTRADLFEMVQKMRIAYNALSPLQTQNSVQSGQLIHVGSDGAALQYASSKPFAITIPSLGITDLTITHPSDPFSQEGIVSILTNGVGHLFSYPGEGSKIMIYGHSSGYPWDISKYTKIFREINKMSIGSRIYVTYKNKIFVYQVNEKKTIPAKDRSLFEPDDSGESLILYTCWPPDSITQRFTVHAIPVETIALK